MTDHHPLHGRWRSTSGDELLVFRPDGSGLVELYDHGRIDSYATFAFETGERVILTWEHEYTPAEGEAAVDVWEIGDEPHTTEPKLTADQLTIDLGLDLPTDYVRAGSAEEAAGHSIPDLLDPRASS